MADPPPPAPRPERAGTGATEPGEAGSHEVSSAFDPESRSVSAARRLAERMVAEWGAEALEWPLVQLVSEVATNAVLHAGTRFEMTLRVEGGRVRCEISDDSPRVPRARHYADDATTGRGVRLVETLAADWGVERRPDGKTVWFELDASALGGGLLPEDDVALDDVAPTAPAPPAPPVRRSRGGGSSGSRQERRPDAGLPVSARLQWHGRAGMAA